MPKKLVSINLDEIDPLTIGKVDYAKIDATTTKEIHCHIRKIVWNPNGFPVQGSEKSDSGWD